LLPLLCCCCCTLVVDENIKKLAGRSKKSADEERSKRFPAVGKVKHMVDGSPSCDPGAGYASYKTSGANPSASITSE